jgi:hypothetical protein
MVSASTAVDDQPRVGAVTMAAAHYVGEGGDMPGGVFKLRAARSHLRKSGLLVGGEAVGAVQHPAGHLGIAVLLFQRRIVAGLTAGGVK